jgi:hypothetical protein
MAELYLEDKPMRRQDIHDVVIESVYRKAKFLAMVSGSQTLKELIGSWGVRKGPTYKNPAALARPATNNRAKPTVPSELQGVMQIFESAGYSINWLAEELPAVYESKGVTLGAAKAEDSENLALSMERVLLSEQECRIATAELPALTRGIAKWFSTSAHNVAGVVEVPAELRPKAAQWYTGTLAAFNEAAFKALLLAAYKQRNTDLMLTGFVGIDLKQVMSDFVEKVAVTATLDSVRTLAPQKKRELENICDVFRYDGVEARVMVQNNLFADTTKDGLDDTVATYKGGLFVEMDMIQMNYLKRIYDVPDPEDTHGKSGFFRAAGRLEVKNPMSGVVIKPSA